MSTVFSGDVGYRGLVKLNNTILLATGGQININHDPIFSSGVWGAGYQNAAEQVAYANNYLKLEGSFDFELTSGQGLSAVNAFAFTNRGSTSGTAIEILPNGQHGFKGVGWCSSFGFSASEGAVVTCNAGFSSFIDTSVDNKILTGTSGNSANGAAGTDGLPFDANGLFPYWATQVYKGGSKVNDVTAWGCDYSSEVVPLKCCGVNSTGGIAYADTAGAPLGPDYILIGTMTAQGNYTVFRLQGDFAPEKYHSSGKMQFEMAPSKTPSTPEAHILIPTAINSSGSTSIQTGSSYITAEFSFTAIGDGTKPPLSIQTGGVTAGV